MIWPHSSSYSHRLYVDNGCHQVVSHNAEPLGSPLFHKHFHPLLSANRTNHPGLVTTLQSLCLKDTSLERQYARTNAFATILSQLSSKSQNTRAQLQSMLRERVVIMAPALLSCEHTVRLDMHGPDCLPMPKITHLSQKMPSTVLLFKSHHSL